MASAELKAALAKIDVATDNIAADIERIKGQIGTGMTDAQVAEVQAVLDAQVAKLEGIAASTEDPVPEPPVEPPVDPPVEDLSFRNRNR